MQEKDRIKNRSKKKKRDAYRQLMETKHFSQIGENYITVLTKRGTKKRTQKRKSEIISKLWANLVIDTSTPCEFTIWRGHRRK